MNDLFSEIKQVISSRRTTKPQAMNGRVIDDETMAAVLQLADYAPTHGLTEPWRFIVYGPGKKPAFCHGHAGLYRANTPGEKFEQARYDKLYTMGDQASHVVIAIMQRGNLPKIPAWEEQAAVAAAVENILLGATALGIASYWGSGGMMQHAAMKNWLGLQDADMVMGILYFGYADKQPVFSRNTEWAQKIKWA